MCAVDVLQITLAQSTQADLATIPSQIFCLSDVIVFTSKVEAAIQTGALPRLQVQQIKHTGKHVQ